MDYSPLGSPVCGILQARILEWFAMSFSRVSSQPRDGTQVSCVQEIFLTQESNQGLLRYRWILYQLSYKRSYEGIKYRFY